MDMELNIPNEKLSFVRHNLTGKIKKVNDLLQLVSDLELLDSDKSEKYLIIDVRHMLKKI